MIYFNELKFFKFFIYNNHSEYLLQFITVSYSVSMNISLAFPSEPPKNTL